MEDILFVIGLAASTEALWALAGAAVTMLGWLTSGQRQRRRIAALEARERAPSLVIQDFRGSMGALYVSKDGLYRAPFEGTGELVSPAPVDVVPGDGPPTAPGASVPVTIVDRPIACLEGEGWRTGHARERWERIKRVAEARPYLRYVAVLDQRTSEGHRHWHGTVLRWDHPWWRDHFPPNGAGCRCSVQQFSADDLADLGYEPSAKAPT